MRGKTTRLVPKKLQQMLRLPHSRRRSASRWRQSTVSTAPTRVYRELLCAFQGAYFRCQILSGSVSLYNLNLSAACPVLGISVDDVSITGITAGEGGRCVYDLESLSRYRNMFLCAAIEYR